MEITLLDGVHARTAAGEALRLQRQQATVLFLLVASGRPLSDEYFRRALWPPSKTPKDQHRPTKAISILRGVLGERITHSDRGTRFEPRPEDSIDLPGWRRWVRRADSLASDDPHAAAHLYDWADDVWLELPGASLPDTEPVREILAELRGEWLSALERRSEVQLQLGEHESVASRLPEAVKDWPEREHLIELLMLALYRSQRPIDALKRYNEHEKYVKKEFGVLPAQSLQDLRQLILDRSPSLDAQVPQVPAADQEVLKSKGGSSLSSVSTARMSVYLTQIGIGGYRPARDYYTALDRAGVEALLAVVPDVRTIQFEAVDLAAHVVRKLALNGVGQFMELGALVPTRLAAHEVARLPRPSMRTRVVYANTDPAMVTYSREMLAGVQDVEYVHATLRSIIDHPDDTPLIDWEQPIGVINQHEINSNPDKALYVDLYAKLGAMLASGSFIMFTCATLEGMSLAVPWALKRVYQTAPDEQLIIRTTEEIRELVPDGFEILDPGEITHTTDLWERYAGQTASDRLQPGPLPRLSVVARKT